MLRMSFRVEVEEDGVRTGDWVASLAAAFGDAVPSFGSLFFLDLLESLPRESCFGTRLVQCLGRVWGDGRDSRLWRRNASSLKTTASLLWATRGARLDPCTDRSTPLTGGELCGWEYTGYAGYQGVVGLFAAFMRRTVAWQLETASLLQRPAAISPKGNGESSRRRRGAAVPQKIGRAAQLSGLVLRWPRVGRCWPRCWPWLWAGESGGGSGRRGRREGESQQTRAAAIEIESDLATWRRWIEESRQTRAVVRNPRAFLVLQLGECTMHRSRGACTGPSVWEMGTGASS